MRTLAARFDFAAMLVEDEKRCRRVAEILTRPCFLELERVSAHRGDRWIKHTDKSADVIVEVLRDPANRAVAFDTKRGRELVADGELENGTRDTEPTATRFAGDLTFPWPGDIDATVAALCELADAIDAGAGFIATEPDHAHARHVALGNAQPKMRAGMSVRRAIERRGRDWHYRQRHSELAGPEWGTFLGAEHLARLDLARVRGSGAFERVVLVSPRLAFLQVTKDPADDLRDDFEARLEAARAPLAPVMMDLGDVNLD